MNNQELIEKYEKLEGVCKDPGAEIARLIFLEDLRELDEPQKVTVPQFVADWIDYCKKHNLTLFGCLDPEGGFESLINETFKGEVRKCIRWCRRESDIFARAWLDGYEIEEEKRYLVKMKGHIHDNVLVYGYGAKRYFFSSSLEGNRRAKHTRKELEKGGFGEVFNSPLFEVEEVEG